MYYAPILTERCSPLIGRSAVHAPSRESRSRRPPSPKAIKPSAMQYTARGAARSASRNSTAVPSYLVVRIATRHTYDLEARRPMHCNAYMVRESSTAGRASGWRPVWPASRMPAARVRRARWHVEAAGQRRLVEGSVEQRRRVASGPVMAFSGRQCVVHHTGPHTHDSARYRPEILH